MRRQTTFWYYFVFTNSRAKELSESKTQPLRIVDELAGTHKSVMTHTDNAFCASWLDLWPFDPKINGLPGLIVDYFCVEFGLSSCIDVWDIACKNRQSDRQTHKRRRNPTHANTIGVDSNTRPVTLASFGSLTKRYPRVNIIITVASCLTSDECETQAVSWSDLWLLNSPIRSYNNSDFFTLQPTWGCLPRILMDTPTINS